jgi:putative Holliday junction resolvase
LTDPAPRPLITTAAADFLAALPSPGRLAGLDPGTKTIGLASCDATWAFATPRHTIKRGKLADDLAALGRFVTAERIIGLVMGLPLNMDGTDSPRTQSVRALARNLAPLGLPILLHDERWSTLAVERSMIDQDVSRARRAQRIDAEAAAWILQGALDQLTRQG